MCARDIFVRGAMEQGQKESRGGKLSPPEIGTSYIAWEPYVNSESTEMRRLHSQRGPAPTLTGYSPWLEIDHNHEVFYSTMHFLSLQDQMSLFLLLRTQPPTYQ